MFYYYFGKIMSYVPFAVSWLCFLYLVALLKTPEIVIDLLDPDRTWTRRLVLTLLFLGFFLALAVGGWRLVGESDAFQYWDKDIRGTLIIIPLLGGSFIAAVELVGLGANMATKAREERDKKLPFKMHDLE